MIRAGRRSLCHRLLQLHLPFCKVCGWTVKGNNLKNGNLLDVLWDTVKEIYARHLEYHYAQPSLDGVVSVYIRGQLEKRILETVGILIPQVAFGN